MADELAPVETTFKMLYGQRHRVVLLSPSEQFPAITFCKFALTCESHQANDALVGENNLHAWSLDLTGRNGYFHNHTLKVEGVQSQAARGSSILPWALLNV